MNLCILLVFYQSRLALQTFGDLLSQQLRNQSAELR